MPAARTFRIHERPDGRFEARNEFPKDSPLGVDVTLNMAIGSAHREATMTAKAEGCRVSIQAMKGGKWKEVDHVDPPRR